MTRTVTNRLHIILSLIAISCMLASTALATAAPWKGKVAFWSSNLEAAGWNNVFHQNATQALGRLPSGVQTMLKTDVVDNPWVQGHEQMKNKLGKFRPEARQVFDLPYIPIPTSKMKFKYLDADMSANMKRNVKFTEGGVEKIRFFFHPLYANKYKELIETYGAKHGEYWATCTSSPRSLVVWQKNKPTKPIWVKVSLHAHLDYYTKRDANGQEKKVGISRVQTEKKAHRSALVNQAFRSLGRGELRKHALEFMPEPAAFVPGDIQYHGARRGFDRATIFRDIPTSLTSTAAGAKKFIPAFAYIKGLKATSERTNIPVMELVKKGLMEPLVRSYLYLGMEHGLSGEMHTQNFLLEVNNRGLPTGKIMVKDLDGYRMDLDMRIRNNKSIDFLNGYKHPFMWAKHSATQGSSSNPAVLHGWFNKLIRNVNGFTTTRTTNGVTKTVYATPAGQLMERLQTDFPQVYTQLKRDAVRRDPSLRGNTDKINRKAIEQVFDKVAQEQFQKITGIAIPADKWGYGQKKGLNYGLGKLRGELFSGQCGLNCQRSQSPLKATWNKLRTASARKADDRTWVRGNPKTFRLIGNNVIEGISRGGKSVGYAILKPADVTQLKTKLRTAGVQAQRRTRVPSGLGRYSSRPTGVQARYSRGR
jgi:hypothetical protein